MNSLTALSTAEQHRLTALESSIERGLQTFWKVGSALKEIRDRRLYRATHGQFGDYCRERWGFGRRAAYQYIDSHAVVQNVRNCALRLPRIESQTRLLTKLSAADQLVAWKRVLQQVDRGKVLTGELVKQVCNAMLATGSPNPEVERESRSGIVVNSLDDLIVSGDRFPCILADPAWPYSNQRTRVATDNHYATMAVDKICQLPVELIAADNAHLHLWTTNSFLFEAQHVIGAWGFTFKSAFVWCKPHYGLGNYYRGAHEYLLLGVRGHLRFADRSVSSWRQFDRAEHSKKPDEVRKMIERVSPGPRIELFARQAAPGWSAWGDQLEPTLSSDLQELKTA